MKVWRYYKKPEKDSSDKQYDLYAITNKKEHAKKFEKERNMDKFIKRCTDEDRSTFVDLVNDNRALFLSMNKFTTGTVLPNGNIKAIDVELLTTDFEMHTVKDEYESSSIITREEYWLSSFDYRIYKNKLIEALRLLEYISHYKLYLNVNIPIDPDDDDYSAPDIWIDEVGVFIRIFKDTLI